MTEADCSTWCMKIIVLGAGASASIDSDRFATMDCFFTAALKNAQNNDDKSLVATLFSTLDDDRAFLTINSTCENLALQYRTLIGLKDKDNHAKVIEVVRDEYLSVLQSRFDGANENLERVLDQCLTQKKPDAYSAILFMINWLLGPISQEHQNKADELFGKLFDRFIGEQFVSTIVSFNYDIIADNALLNWVVSLNKQIADADLKQILTRQDAFKGKLDPSQIPDFDRINGSFPDPPNCEEIGKNATGGLSRLRLLKPHGSLSFCKRRENDEAKETCPLVNVQNRFSAFPSLGDARIIDFEGSTRFPRVEPLIVPPTSIKVKSYPILYEAERTFLDALENSNTKQVIIIGWSLPPTDTDHFNAIRSRILRRSPQHQLEELIVIDKKPSQNDGYFDRMEALFQPKRMKKVHQGFSLDAINSLSDP